VLLVAAIAAVGSHPSVRTRRAQRAQPPPAANAPSDQASPRGQPIVIPDGTELTQNQREGMEWMAVPEIPAAGSLPRVTYADGTAVDPDRRDQVLRDRGILPAAPNATDEGALPSVEEAPGASERGQESVPEPSE
jgi:hypothetical protein